MLLQLGQVLSGYLPMHLSAGNVSVQAMGFTSQSFQFLPDTHLAQRWQQPAATDSDFDLNTVRYLEVVRDIALNPGWIGLDATITQPMQAFTWMGQHIYRLNQTLHHILEDGLACFEPGQLPPIQVLAVPILSTVGVDGFCNLQVQPMTLMIDPSRVVAADWPNLVAHELAHGLVRSAGHGPAFCDRLSFLCLAMDLPCPPPNGLEAEVLRYWPPCRPNPDAQRFWLGGTGVESDH
jgi:hypothetical protein